MTYAVVLAAVSAALLAIGIGLIYAPAGIIAAGLLGLTAAYLLAYYHARGGRQT